MVHVWQQGTPDDTKMLSNWLEKIPGSSQSFEVVQISILYLSPISPAPLI
jgi:hypothetical protein